MKKLILIFIVTCILLSGCQKNSIAVKDLEEHYLLLTQNITELLEDAANFNSISCRSYIDLGFIEAEKIGHFSIDVDEDTYIDINLFIDDNGMEQFSILYQKNITNLDDVASLDCGELICEIANSISVRELTNEELSEFFNRVEIKKQSVSNDDKFDNNTIIKEYEYLPSILIPDIKLDYELYVISRQASKTQYREIFEVSGNTKY